MEDEALSRAAATAYFTIFSLAQLLLIVITIAGLAFGREAAQAAIMGQFSGLMGKGRCWHRCWHRCCRARAAKASNPGRSRRAAEHA
jgi:hypothetical protein